MNEWMDEDLLHHNNEWEKNKLIIKYKNNVLQMADSQAAELNEAARMQTVSY